MHRHVAELTVTLVRNREVYRQVCAMYVVSCWRVLSLERVDGVMVGCHHRVTEAELPVVLARLDELAAEWHEQGYSVQRHVRRPSEILG